MLAWLSLWSEVQTCIWLSWCHCHSLSLASVKSRLVLPFWYRPTWVVPDKGPLKGCVCVCISPWYLFESNFYLWNPTACQSVARMHEKHMKANERVIKNTVTYLILLKMQWCLYITLLWQQWCHSIPMTSHCRCCGEWIVLNCTGGVEYRLQQNCSGVYAYRSRCSYDVTLPSGWRRWNIAKWQSLCNDRTAWCDPCRGLVAKPLVGI